MKNYEYEQNKIMKVQSRCLKNVEKMWAFPRV